MLTSLRIQNFRSIRDASVKLGQVNLFIGPNNSGKSNFLKGIGLFASIIESYPEKPNTDLHSHFSLMVTRPKENEQYISAINFSFKLSSEDVKEHFIAFPNSRLEILGDNFLQIINQPDLSPNSREKQIRPLLNSFHEALRELSPLVKGAVIYQPDPRRFKLSSTIKPEFKLSYNGSNVVSFLFNLNQNYRKQYSELEQDFTRSLTDLVLISTPVVNYMPNTNLEKDVPKEEAAVFKLKFFDKNDIGYWAEEVSEGVLYFLALLCIVHQPDPPKLLLLEEPEKGIHPRRIKEVMNFIFELARLRDIQIILTSHSPYVVDHFADIPECISVFDRKDGETVIQNAADIIKETNDKLEAAGQEPIRYTDALGEYWVSGFLGGVPL